MIDMDALKWWATRISFAVLLVALGAGVGHWTRDEPVPAECDDRAVSMLMAAEHVLTRTEAMLRETSALLEAKP
jgi:hypothetical protein